MLKIRVKTPSYENEDHKIYIGTVSDISQKLGKSGKLPETEITTINLAVSKNNSKFYDVVLFQYQKDIVNGDLICLWKDYEYNVWRCATIYNYPSFCKLAKTNSDLMKYFKGKAPESEVISLKFDYEKENNND